jgi:hypothetical protein
MTTETPAYQLIDSGVRVVDPEHLVFGMMSDFPPDGVATSTSSRPVGHCARGHPFGD